MENKKDLVKFNMTKEMSSSLIEFNKLKKELIVLKENNCYSNNIILIENRLEELRKLFINEFKKNNKEEVKKYLEKDQI